MSILPIVQFPDLVLETICQPISNITTEIKTLAADMAETMYEAPGVGLAAPQVGQNIRLVVIDVSENKDQLLTLINPEIVHTSAEVELGEEGCLSLPGIYEKVSRYAEVTVRFTDLEGQQHELQADGLLAICLQHELDHLDGKVFVDHLSRLKRDRACAKLRKKRLQQKS